MKIREGAYYRTRGGDVVGPMAEPMNFATEKWKFSAPGYNDGVPCWTDEGRWCEFDDSHRCDLISEVYVSDTPPELADIRVGGGGGEAPAPETKTLRDEFAMALMDADDFMVGFKEHAEQLYRAADAMMEARKK
jgi:hypothetical protein